MPDAREDGQDWGEHAERAEEIGLLASNVNAPQSLAADFGELGLDYEQVGEVQAWTGQRVEIYEYTKGGETRYGACWGERVAVDEVRYDSLVFESEPDKAAIETGAEIVNSREG